MGELASSTTGTSPTKTPQSRVMSQRAVIQKQRLFFPALALLILSPLAVLLDIVGITVSLTNDELLAAALTVPFLLIHSLTIVGAVYMMQLKSYSAARAVAVAACFPLCSPILWLGAPFGIWALVVLLSHDAEEVFDDDGRAKLTVESELLLFAEVGDFGETIIHSGKRCGVRANQAKHVALLTLTGTSQLRAGEKGGAKLTFPDLQAQPEWLSIGTVCELLDGDRPIGTACVEQVYLY